VHYHFVRERVLFGKVELQYVPTDRQTADIFTKPLGLDKLRQFSGALGLRHLDVPNWRGRNDQDWKKARKEQEPEARDAESTERRKKAEPKAAEPSLEKTDDFDSRSDGANDSESESRSERADERRCDSEMVNQPRPKRTRRTQRMRQCHDSKEVEKGRCRPGGSMLRKVRIEEHVRGCPKDQTSNMQLEFRGKAKTRRYNGTPCDTENRVSPKTRNSVCRREDTEDTKTRKSV
jgi:vacuolar-type H+-ATPase subunit I/STV1